MNGGFVYQMGLKNSLIVMIIILLEVRWCNACLEQERNALLQLKAYFNYPNGTSLSSWELDSDCCEWESVDCSVDIRRVSKLFLARTRDSRLGDWYLNASLFLPLEKLNVLQLSENHIAGFLGNEGLERLSRLKNLELLDLSDNVFHNSNILSSLSGISSLKSLYLYNIGLKGMINIHELNNLTSLKELVLGGNEIEGFKSFHDVTGLSNLSVVKLDYITTNGRSISLQPLTAFPSVKFFTLRGNSIQGRTFAQVEYLTNLEELYLDYSSLDEESLQTLGSLPSLKILSSINGTLHATKGLSGFNNLEYLDLTFSTVNSSFLQIIGSMTSLKKLYMSGSGLSGALPTSQGLCKLIYLQELDISFNELSGTLPWCLANLTSLQTLNLYSNHLTGNIASSPLRNLLSIRKLYLSHNNFRIPITLAPFLNHSKLKDLDLQNSEVYSDEEEHNLTPSFQLQYLLFSGHGYGGALTKFLYQQFGLEVLWLSNIQMRGSFPYWLIENNTKLVGFYLDNDTLSGPIKLPINPHMNLSSLDISNNGFSGYIPTEIAALSKLASLNMSGNSFTGSIPSSFGNMSSLQVLDLSNNWLSGGIPERMTTSCFSLNFLLLSNNKLDGPIFSGYSNLTNLWELLLDGNQFNGNIPDGLSTSSSLTRFYANNNHLSGKIPGWMGNMSSLEVLDLSQNNLSGSLPSHFSPLQMQQVYLSRNKLQGSLHDAFRDCSELMTLDLSHNYFTGSIPGWIDRFPQLSYLLLSHNKLQGQIPIQLSKLNQLSLIDLSHNNLSGHILPCLKFNSEWNRQQETISAPSPDPMQQPIEFTTKSNSYTYQESILTFLSGIDLSSNNLTGEIPAEIGYLSKIQVLNLSHNSLTGQIPQTFSNLRQIESMDLSYNSLDGSIPPQLVELYALAAFSVAHNNLSGKIPERVAQFATFDKSSYEGNPFLCGIPLQKRCTKASSSMPGASNEDKEESDSYIDMGVFCVSFSVSYCMVLLAMFAVLYINPNWRGAWFYFIEVFILDKFRMQTKFRAS